MNWDPDAYMSMDFETNGEKPEYALQPWRIKQKKAWATSLVWAWEEQDGNVQTRGSLFPTKMMMVEMLEQALDEKRIVVGWYVQFDIQILLAYGLEKLVTRLQWFDGMLAWKHYYVEPEYEEKGPNRFSYSLKQAVSKFIPEYAGYQADIDFQTTDPAELKKLHKYNRRDTVFTLMIARMMWEKLTSRQRAAATIEAQCLPMVAAANLRGMVIDTIQAHELAAKQDHIAAEMLKILAPHGVTEKIVRSPAQLGTLLYDVWKLPVLKETKGGVSGKVSRSTDKESLHELAFMDLRAKNLRAYREALNAKTKFAMRKIESTHYNGDGCSHPQAIVYSAYSGRMTYSSKQGKNKDERQIGFALHQEKHEIEFRELVLAPPGYTLVEFDADGQEFRWMAIATGDPVMLQLCQPGEDAHSFMGARIAEMDYRTLIARVAEGDLLAIAERQLGKVATLSLQYRTSASKLRSVARVQYDIPMDLDTATKIKAVYLKTYSFMKPYWANQIARTQALGYVETFAGRRVQVKGDWNGSWGWAMGSTAINYRIQGTGADMKYLAMMVIRDYLTEIGAHFGWDLHDGLYLYIPDHKVDVAVPYIKRALDSLPYGVAWGFVPPIPLTWSCKTGKDWGHLHKYKFK